MCVGHRQNASARAILTGNRQVKASKNKLNILSWPTDAGQ